MTIIQRLRCFATNSVLEWSFMDNQPFSDTEIGAVPRTRVFVLLDGTFVVRWQETRVQELQTGQYRTYEKREFGAPITDYELNQLRSSGIVERFDEQTVWLCPLPQHYEVQYLTLWEQRRTRSYYLNTTLGTERMAEVVGALTNLGLEAHYLPRERDGFVVIWGPNGLSFHHFDDAEKARLLLVERLPTLFDESVVAFVETSLRT